VPVLLFILSASTQAIAGMNHVIEQSLLTASTRSAAKIANLLCTAVIAMTAMIAVFQIKYGI
jgi:succinate dehydrogenase hydrophobic anchor subunit